MSIKEKKKEILLVLVLAMVMLALTACGGNNTESKRTDLNFAIASEPNSLDPMAIAMMSTFTVTDSIYDNLVEESDNGKYRGALAESYDISKDGKTYTFHLRKGVKFHDGSTMTADDVVFSINRTIKKGWAFDMTAAIKNVEKVDANTVRLNLTKPFGGMLGSLASPYFSVMSKNYLKEHGDKVAERKPMGTGAYKFVEWKNGDHITVEANKNYWGGAPKIKTVTFKPITDKNTGLVALQGNETDAYLNVNYSDIDSIKHDDKLEIKQTDAASVLSINMNIERKPFNNLKVRQAINYAINKENIISGALEGNGKEANSAISPTCEGYSKDVMAYKYNPEKAKALLKAAKVDGLKVTIKIKEDTKVQKVAQVVQSQLKAVGIQAKIEIMEAGAYTTDVYTNGNYQMTITSWTAMFTDAYSLLYSQFHKDCYGPTGNITHVRSDKLSDMLDSAAEKSGSAKEDAYKKVAQYINDSAYVVPMVYEPTTITTNASLKGVKANPLGVYKIKEFYWE